MYTEEFQLQECLLLLLIISYIFLLRLLFNYNQLTRFFSLLCWWDYQVEAWAKQGKTKHLKKKNVLVLVEFWGAKAPPAKMHFTSHSLPERKAYTNLKQGDKQKEFLSYSV